MINHKTKLMKLLEKSHEPNKWYYECSKCGRREEFFSHSRAAAERTIYSISQFRLAACHALGTISIWDTDEGCIYCWSCLCRIAGFIFNDTDCIAATMAHMLSWEDIMASQVPLNNRAPADKPKTVEEIKQITGVDEAIKEKIRIEQKIEEKVEKLITEVNEETKKDRNDFDEMYQNATEREIDDLSNERT